MLRKVLNPILFLPFTFFINSINVLSGENLDNIDKVLEEKSDKLFINRQEIEKII